MEKGTFLREETIAKWKSRDGAHWYVLRNALTGSYKASQDVLDLEDGWDIIDVYQGGKALETAF